MRPGLSSENEEELLNKQENPLQYNDEILFPEKVKLNLDYYYQLSFKKDAQILLKTFSVLSK